MNGRGIKPAHGAEDAPAQVSRTALRALGGWLRPFLGVIMLNLLLTLVLSAVDLSVPKLLKWLINGLVDAGQAIADAPPDGRAALRADAWQRTLTLLGAFAAAFCVAIALRRIQMRRVVRMGQEFMCGMRERFFEHLQALDIAYFDRMKAGQIISRGTGDMDALEEVVEWAPLQLVSAVISLVGVVALMAWEDCVMFAAAVPLFVLQAAVTRHYRRRAAGTWRELRRQSGLLTANLAESIAGARVMQAFAREPASLQAFDELADDLYSMRMDTARIMGRYMIWTNSISTAATVMVLALGGWRVAWGELSPGAVAAFLGYIGMFFRPIEMISEIYNSLLHALAGAERILEVLQAQPRIVDRPGALDPAAVRGDVRLDHVTFAYNPGVPVLHDVSLHARPGESVALVGPTGAGKTTICRLIARFYETEIGRVLVDGRDVRELTQRGLHRHTGIVLQENFLFSGAVMDNIRYGKPGAADGEVEDCARRVGSHAAIAALPKGYATEVGERGESLSAGQRQLICYTRAMLAAPAILILDEATSAVDTRTEAALQEALRQLTEKRTCFIVAHRLSTVRRADRVLVVENGRITEEGSHDALLASGGRYARMYEEFIRSE